jgi:hypothetical protein
LHLGFFTCGFHIAFLVTHLPGEVALCGLPQSVASWSLAIIGIANVAGSLIIGASGGALPQQIYFVLDVRLARAADCGVFDAAAHRHLPFICLPPGWALLGWPRCRPPPPLWVSCLACAIWPLCLASPCYRTKSVAFWVLIWAALPSARFGDFGWMWYADMALAAAAALLNLPIREQKIARTAAA